MNAVADPTLRVENRLYKDGARFVIGVDEVGRGAIAGPVAIGVCVVDRAVGRYPVGLRDSKMLAEKRREELAPLARSWALYSAVGLASNDEIDSIGLTAALGLAGRRALEQIVELGAQLDDSIVLLDGNHDYLNPMLSSPVQVTLRPKADRDCASVAAASVVAKVHRDRMMIDADVAIPGYGWTSNKGYGCDTHYAAIRELGPSELHRQTWLHLDEPLPGLGFGELIETQLSPP